MSGAEQVIAAVRGNVENLRMRVRGPHETRHVAAMLMPAVEALPKSDRRRLPAQLLNVVTIEWARTLHDAAIANVIEEPVWAEIAGQFERVLALRESETGA
jgi:hypothetical protein